MELLTLVLVDDEPIILKGLIQTYQWESMGFQVIGSARDGEEALKLIEEKQPDVVLTDVRMKKLDGLELIEKAKERGWKTDFVIISAYRDFEYAQKACRHGALSYLVKPIDDRELERTMSEIHKRCLEKKYKEKNYMLWEKILVEDRENFLNQMLARYLDNGIAEAEIRDFFYSLSREEELEHYFVVAAAGIDLAQQVVNQKEFDMKQYLLDATLYKMLRTDYQVWTVRTAEGVACYIVDLGETAKVEKVKEILKTLRLEMKAELISALSIAGKGLEGMKNAYLQAQELFAVASEAGAGLLTVKEQAQVPAVKEQYSTDVETQILTAIRKNADMQMKKAYEKFIYTLPESEETGRLYLHRLAVRVEIALQEGGSLTGEIKSSFLSFYHMLEQIALLKMIDILYQLLRSVIELRIASENTLSEEYFRDDIQTAITYIKEHLDDETLSVTGVSEKVFLSPVYFGRMFKKVTNVSFKRYVQNLRIEKAKELLLEDRENIAGICIKVGIPNPSYFTQLFKQSTGMLPSEYKRSLE